MATYNSYFESLIRIPRPPPVARAIKRRIFERGKQSFIASALPLWTGVGPRVQRHAFF